MNVPPHSYLFIRLFNFGKIIEIVFHSDTDDVYSVRSQQPLSCHQLTEMLLKSTAHRKYHLDTVPKSRAHLTDVIAPGNHKHYWWVTCKYVL